MKLSLKKKDFDKTEHKPLRNPIIHEKQELKKRPSSYIFIIIKFHQRFQAQQIFATKKLTKHKQKLRYIQQTENRYGPPDPTRQLQATETLENSRTRVGVFN